ncbi:MAG: right-handed parallel beta-helix repeat-containing protein [Phycisphaerales bacterium]|nr:right-handed parallel beta-helix repeat-containing protein [Phycisphaerales bacterium]
MRLAFMLAAMILTFSTAAHAGPLSPPLGPVASTPGPEPRIAISAANTPGDGDSIFKITQPGSYYLTGNVTAVANKHGIEITSSGVTIDLNGFDLVGVPGMGTFDGIITSLASLRAIVISNGTVRNWGGDGIDLSSGGSLGVRVENIIAVGNAGYGIRVDAFSNLRHCIATANLTGGILTGSGCTLTQCSAYLNTGVGILAFNACILEGCTSSNNSGGGYNLGFGCTISRSAANSNTGNGFFVSSRSVITDCTSNFNSLDGFRFSSSCLVRSNTASDNGSGGDGAGFHALNSDNRIEDNNSTGADRGIDVDSAGNFIVRNTCSGNTTDWDIAANNIYGPIIDRRIPSPVASSPAVTGTAAASTLGSTDPNANYTY